MRSEIGSKTVLLFFLFLLVSVFFMPCASLALSQSALDLDQDGDCDEGVCELPLVSSVAVAFHRADLLMPSAVELGGWDFSEQACYYRQSVLEGWAQERQAIYGPDGERARSVADFDHKYLPRLHGKMPDYVWGALGETATIMQMTL